MSALPYDFRPLKNSDEELGETFALLRSVWPVNNRLTLKYLDWLYRENPAGRAIGCNAYHGGRLAGHYVIIPFSAQLDGQNFTAALSLNTAVDESHRGQGLFRKLAEATYATAAEDGIDHVVGIANANSTPGFVKSLGFQLVTQLEPYLIFGKAEVLLTGNVSWRRNWTADSLAWRLSAPQCSYWFDPRGESLSVYGQTKYVGLYGVLKVEDNPELQLTIRRHLKSITTLRPTLWFGKSPRLKLPAAALRFPERLRPSPFNLIFRDLSGAHRQLDGGSIHFEAVDFDVM